MRQIDRIAREIKKDFCATYNNYYSSLTVYLNTETEQLYLMYWGKGETWIEHPKHLVPLVNYSTYHGNWAKEYGNYRNWKLTKKQIAHDIIESTRGYSLLESEYFGKVRIPTWLMQEIQHYLSH